MLKKSFFFSIPGRQLPREILVSRLNMAIVILKFKENVLKEYLVGDGKILIGRSPDCDILIDNPAVSKYHASIEYVDGIHRVSDLSSTNGTYLNNGRISSAAELNDDDTIAIGKHTLAYMTTEDLPSHGFSGYGDQTMLVSPSPGKRGKSKNHPGRKTARLSVIESDRRKEFSLSKEETALGSGPECGIKIPGFFTPQKLAAFRREGSVYRLYSYSRWFTVSVNGKTVGPGKPVKLKKNDIVQVRGSKFVFKDG